MYSRIISSSRPTVEIKYPPTPEVLPDKVALALHVSARDVNRALTLDLSDHLRHRILRRNRDHHMNMVRHQVAFFDPDLLLLRQTPHHLSKLLSDLPDYRLLPVLRNEHNVILTLPPAVA